MFYSHTFLARKGPLGTVWCAAHLQHKLTKAQYASTNIGSTVERIMFPEVPIALRMSGHLLLGVVRIYSKQVEYLYKECNVILFRIGRAFTSVNVNLPEEATHAPFHSITLPETFKLDALEVEEDILLDGFEGKHLKRLEEITLTDQIPTERDPFVAFTIDEDALRESFKLMEDDPAFRVRAMEKDSHPSVPEDPAADHQSPSSSDRARVDERIVEDSNHQVYPETETLRDAGHDYQMGNPLLDDIMEPDIVLEKQMLDDKGAFTPVKEPSASAGLSPQSKNLQELLSGTSEHEHFDVNMSFGHLSPDLAIRSTPPAEQPQIVQPQARKPQQKWRKRKQHFDSKTVLSNACMKRALNDTSDLRRVKKSGPCSSLDVWRSNKRLKRDAIFDETLFTGLSADLCNLYQRDYISSKPNLFPSEDALSNSVAGTEPESNIDPEIEILRNYEGPGNDVLSEIQRPSSECIPSPSTCFTRIDDFTPVTTNLGSESELLTTGKEMLPTPDLTASTRSHESEMRTPQPSSAGLDFGCTALSDIPESAGELYFLEQDDNSPGSLRTPESGYSLRNEGGTQEFDKLSARTRAVAQFFKRQSSTTPMSEESSDKLSLNSILEGKSRKLSARMFSETLVLKNYGYVDVYQERPYDNIILKITSKLSKDLV